MLLIPAIDIRAGRCVRLLKGDFDRETRYPFDPVALAASYAEQGAPWLHVVDLDGAASGKPVNLGLVGQISQTAGICVQLGGGIRAEADLDAALDIVQRVVVGSLAVKSPGIVEQWLLRHGGERLTLALDVRLDEDGVPRVATHGWTQSSPTSLWEAIDRFLPCGLKHVLCTDVARDGALSGPNLELYAQCKRRAPQIILQASGGIRNRSDLDHLAALGVDSAISGKALLEGRLAREEIQPFLHAE